MLELIEYFRLSIPNFRQEAKLLFDLFKGQENTKRSKQLLQQEKIDQQALDEWLTQPIVPPSLVYLNSFISVSKFWLSIHTMHQCTLFWNRLCIVSNTRWEIEGNWLWQQNLRSSRMQNITAQSLSFNEYLYYAKNFDVFTDFNLLTYLKTSCKLSSKSSL